MHLKGVRFGFPIVKRFSALKHHETYPVSWNRHAGLEIHYVLKGNIAWELQRHLEALTLSGGSFGIVPARIPHRPLNDNGTPAIRLGVILEPPRPEWTVGTPFSPDDLRRMFRRFGQHACSARRYTPRLAAILRDLFEALTIENATDQDGQLKLRMLSSSLLHETYSVLGESERPAKGRDVIPKICKWIDAHYAEKITVPQLIKLSGYGRSQFFTLFLADTGMTPKDYLVRVRIEQAKRKLHQRRHAGSILDIALACGFHSAAAFAATFRRHVGLTPRQFRASRRPDDSRPL